LFQDTPTTHPVAAAALDAGALAAALLAAALAAALGAGVLDPEHAANKIAATPASEASLRFTMC
jgi:hypothetical protein